MMEAQPDLLTMTDAQCGVLDYMTDDLAYPFSQVASDTGITTKECRAITHHFHAMGIAEFGPLREHAGPKIVGRGYWLSADGYKLRRKMQRLLVAPPTENR